MAEAIFVLRNTAGAIVYDNRVTAVGCLAASPVVPANTAQVFSYPAFVGRSAIVMTTVGNRTTGVTVDYALGYPRVTFAAFSLVRNALIWIY